MTGWRISIASQAKGSDTERTVFHHGQESHTPIEAAYIRADHSVTFTFCLQQGGAPYTGVLSKLWSGMSRFPEKEKSGRVRIRGSFRRIIYERSRNRELSRDVSFCAQPR
jgi:hypothetical protein